MRTIPWLTAAVVGLLIGGRAGGVSANLLYGFGQIILQSDRREAGEARGARAADTVIGGREASATPNV